MSNKHLRLTLVRSITGRLPRHTATVKALNLRRIGQVIEVKDCPSMRGMINKIPYLLKVEEIQKDAS